MTSEYKERLFDRIVNTMYINPSIFPIVKVLHDRYTNETTKESLIKHYISEYIGLKVTFNYHYSNLINFWNVGTQTFIDMFENLIVTRVLVHYFGIPVTKDDYEMYDNFIKSL